MKMVTAEDMRRKCGYMTQFDAIMEALERIDSGDRLEWGHPISNFEVEKLKKLGFEVLERNPNKYIPEDEIWAIIMW